MVEHLAAGVLNSFLSSTRRPSASMATMGRALAPPARNQLLLKGFLSPAPRRIKVKQKVASDDLRYLSQCQEWLCCPSHSVCCPIRHRHVMLQEFDERTRRRPQFVSKPHLKYPRTIQSFPPTEFRRHVSQTARNASQDPPNHHSKPQSEPHSPSVEPPPLPDDPHERLIALSSLSDVPLDLAWSTYEEVKANPKYPSFFAGRLLALSENMMDKIETRYAPLDLPELSSWGARVESMLQDFDTRLSTSEIYDYRRCCLLSRASAAQGELDKAVSHLHTTFSIRLRHDEEKERLLRVYEGIILAYWHRHGAIEVLEFVLSQWSRLAPFIASRFSRSTESLEVGRSMRLTARMALTSLDSPASVVSRWDWDVTKKTRAGHLLVEVYCKMELAREAYDVYREMDARHIHIAPGLKLYMARSLARDDQHDEARYLFDSFPPEEGKRYYLASGLYIAAQAGDTDRSTKFFEKLRPKNWITSYDIAQLMRSYAERGQTDEVLRIFGEYFSLDDPASNNYTLESLHFVYILFSHAQQGNMEGIDIWLSRMMASNFEPDIQTYSIILRGFALQGDIESVIDVLDQMQAQGIEPNRATYTSIITLLAHRKDTTGAEAIYERAIQEGVLPDRRMLTAIMNAHVEAGSWLSVIRIFDYLGSKPDWNLRLSIEVYNTLLKAYILIGAPFRTVSKLFLKLEGMGLQPDAYSYALLIQSACDSGLMDMAADIFKELEKLSQGRQPSTMNSYILTIIMAGFLRTGDKVRAKAVYDNMLERGIEPTAITFNTILRAYGEENTIESLDIASDFVRNLLETPERSRSWNIPSHGRTTALQHIYRPLVQAYSRHEKVEDVEGLVQELIDAGGAPSLGILTTLLDTYRKTFNIEAAKQLWPELFRRGLGRLKSQAALLKKGNIHNPSRQMLKGNTLSLALSIYIDALSAAGLHDEVPIVWKQLQDHGFTFDSHNWNHLVIALLRAGEAERGFWVVEKVILPYYRMSQRVRPLSNALNPSQQQQQQQQDPQSDAAATDPPDDQTSDSSQPTDSNSNSSSNEAPSPPPDPPMHRAKRRAVAVQAFLKAAETNAEIAALLDHADDDWTSPLRVLHQISPTWNIWRPHAVVLSELLGVLSTWQGGRLVRATPGFDERGVVGAGGFGGGAGGFDDGGIQDDAEEQQGEGEGEVAELDEAAKAHELLERVTKLYPATVRAVENHGIEEKRRLGVNYDRAYNWG